MVGPLAVVGLYEQKIPLAGKICVYNVFGKARFAVGRAAQFDRNFRVFLTVAPYADVLCQTV